MSHTMTAAQALLEQYDRTIRTLNHADREASAIERQAHSKRAEAHALFAEAQRIQLAIWALEGKPAEPDTPGQANAAVRERQSELRREPRPARCD